MQNAVKKGLRAIVCNGLEPVSNRRILELSLRYPEFKPALGIYPLQAVHKLIRDYPEPMPEFDVDSEIAFIRKCIAEGKAIAVGECGLDGYWGKEETFAEQERVLCELAEVASEFDVPIIVHSRKLEKRTLELLSSFNLTKVVMHCFCGKVKLAIRYAENKDFCFSIPANVRKNENFVKMLEKLPLRNILTETDAPYLAPVRGERNEPANVAGTIEYFAELKELQPQEAADIVWKNYSRLFDQK